MGVRRLASVSRARLAEVRRYFILYHLETPSIIRSEPYLARVNAPTEWSRQIMPLLKNFIRGGGQRMTFGLGGGAIVAPIQFDRPEMPLFRSAAKKIGALDRIVSTALLETDEIASAIPSREKSLRQPDQSFAALLIIEALDDLALDVAIDELRKTEYSGVQITRYEQIFGLDKAG